jgi:AcrR family transcriptional regulator
MGPVRVRSRRGEGDRLREEILDAVGALLDETQDESAVSIRAIADRVGVTPPSIYRHFADKDALLSAVCAGVFAELQSGIDAAVAEATTRLDALERAGRCYIEFGLAHPEHYRLVFMKPPLQPMGMTREEFLAEIAAGGCAVEDEAFSGDALAGSQTFGALQALVEAVLADVPGRRRPDPYVATTMFWMAVHGITSLRITKPDFPWPPVGEQYDALMWPWRELVG